jgi:hypothetical protein
VPRHPKYKTEVRCGFPVACCDAPGREPERLSRCCSCNSSISPHDVLLVWYRNRGGTETAPRLPACLQVCRGFQATGLCAYGNRCRFIHQFEGGGGHLPDMPNPADCASGGQPGSAHDSGSLLTSPAALAAALAAAASAAAQHQAVGSKHGQALGGSTVGGLFGGALAAGDLSSSVQQGYVEDGVLSLEDDMVAAAVSVPPRGGLVPRQLDAASRLVRACVQAGVHACVRACVRACVHACVRACGQAGRQAGRQACRQAGWHSILCCL